MRRRQPRPQTTSMADPLGMLTMLWLDMVLEILYRLPVKSLLILKCVCKPLNSIISDSKFAKDHLRLSQTRHDHLVLCATGMFSNTDFLLFDSRLPSTFDNSTRCPTIIPKTIIKFPLNPFNICDVRLTNSCNGVICFKRIKHKNYDLVVWNPSTRKHKILPPLEILLQDTFETRYSIGYDAFRDNYKVVVITYDLFNRSNFFCKTEVRVHTLGTNFWKRISDFPSEITGAPYRCHGIFVGGTINWVIQRDHENDSSWVILSLDLENESYQEISQPDFGLDPLKNFSLGVSRNCLSVLAHTKDFLDIWVMKDYGNKYSWNKFVSVPFAELGRRCSDFFSLVYISEEDDQLFLEFFCSLFIYNYKNHTLKIPEIQGFPSNMFTFNVYFESLISP